MANDKSAPRSRHSLLRGLKHKLAPRPQSLVIGNPTYTPEFHQQPVHKPRIPESHARDFDFAPRPQPRTTRSDIENVLCKYALASPGPPSPYPYPQSPTHSNPLLSPGSIPPSPSFSNSSAASDGYPVTPIASQFNHPSSRTPERRKIARTGSENDAHPQIMKPGGGLNSASRRRLTPLALPEKRSVTAVPKLRAAPVSPLVVRPPVVAYKIASPRASSAVMTWSEPGREWGTSTDRARSPVPPPILEEPDPEEDWTLGLTSLQVSRKAGKSTLVARTEEEEEAARKVELGAKKASVPSPSSYFAIHPNRRKAAVASSASSVGDSSSSVLDSASSIVESSNSSRLDAPSVLGIPDLVDGEVVTNPRPPPKTRHVSFSPLPEEHIPLNTRRSSSKPNTADIELSLKNAAEALEEASAILLAKRKADGWDE